MPSLHATPHAPPCQPSSPHYHSMHHHVKQLPLTLLTPSGQAMPLPAMPMSMPLPMPKLTATSLAPLAPPLPSLPNLVNQLPLTSLVTPVQTQPEETTRSSQPPRAHAPAALLTVRKDASTISSPPTTPCPHIAPAAYPHSQAPPRHGRLIAGDPQPSPSPPPTRRCVSGHRTSPTRVDRLPPSCAHDDERHDALSCPACSPIDRKSVV